MANISIISNKGALEFASAVLEYKKWFPRAYSHRAVPWNEGE